MVDCSQQSVTFFPDVGAQLLGGFPATPGKMIKRLGEYARDKANGKNRDKVWNVLE